MKRILGVHLAKDLRLAFADPWALVLSLAIPIVLGGLMSLAFGSAGDAQPKAVVWLADEDDSVLSGLLVGALGSGRMPVELHEADWPTASAALEAGEGSVAVRLPKGFGERLLLDEPVTLDVVTNPAQTVLPGIVTGFLEILREAHFYLHQLVGPEIQLMARGPAGDATTFGNAEVAAMSIRINTLVRELEERLFPPQLALEARPVEEKRAFDRPLSHLLVPGVLVMALLFLAQAFAENLWRERDVPTLKRILTTPHGLVDYIVSKTLSATLLLAVIFAACLVLGGLVFELPWRSMPAIWLLTTFAGASFYVLFGFFGSFASNQRGANLIANMLIFPLIMLGGSFFPLETMPKGLAAVGRMTPNGAVVAAIDEAFALGAPAWGFAYLVVAVTGVVGAAGFVWGVQRGVRG